jgi:hypothetical protein
VYTGGGGERRWGDNVEVEWEGAES